MLEFTHGELPLELIKAPSPAGEGATYLIIGAVSSNVTARVGATFLVTGPGTVSVTVDAGNTDSVTSTVSFKI